MPVNYSTLPIEKLKLSVRSFNCLKRSGINFISELLELSTDDLYNIKNMGKKSVDEIQNVISKIADIETETIAFEDVDEKECFILDTHIKKLNLSNRSYNCLINNGISEVSQLVWLEQEQIENFKNAGVKSINEIVEIIDKIDTILLEENEQRVLKESISKDIFDAITETTEFYNISYARAVLIWKQSFNESDSKNTEDVVFYAYENTILTELLENKILNITTNWNYEFEVDKLRYVLPKHLIETTMMERKIIKCEEDGKILNLGDGVYAIKYPSVLDFINGLEDERSKELLCYRLDGKTLNEIGEITGVTRERVRQLCIKALNNHPRFKEDKYIDLFGIYELGIEDFLSIFDEKAETYYYLKMIDNIPSAEKLSMKNMLDDSSISNNIKRRVEAAVYKDHIFDKGIYIPKSKIELFEHYFCNYCIDQMQMEQICKGYCDFLERSGLQKNEKLAIEPRTYSNKLSECNYALASRGDCYRYYNIGSEEKDYAFLVEELNIPDFTDKEISTLKLFREHTELMELYDIRDEYELHNLLRKIWNDYGTCQVNFAKMPTIRIGNSDEKAQMYDFLIQTSPISGVDISDAYEEAYGVKSNMALTRFIKYFDIYYHQGIFKVDFETMTNEQFEYMRNILTDDFYSLTYVKRLFFKEFPNASTGLINSHNIKLLGFQNYSSYILKREYSATSYVEKLLNQKDVFDIGDFPRELTNLVIFGSVLYEKRKQREIIEYSPHKYLNVSRLIAIGVVKPALEEYCCAVANFVEKESYFTITSLRNAGFTHSLDELDFEDWFYSSLVIEEDDEFSYIRIGGTRLMYRGQKAITTSSFLEAFVERERAIDIYDLESILSENYGINVSRWNLIDAIRKSSLYYDSIMEKVYVDYDTYFEEI